ncbi:hypothetical protein RSSM_05876 [Rhodopirellula sallentina SM41]|uniref:Uncharacterized protein n=1 Tax=Rhodopirellula sallentina SM41 TaxID=1263870 RepID=M5TUC1_9BACT|nr:hypothetical protein RSSM_05876 [Rhodopirellula sallentina SM41]
MLSPTQATFIGAVFPSANATIEVTNTVAVAMKVMILFGIVLCFVWFAERWEQ